MSQYGAAVEGKNSDEICMSLEELFEVFGKYLW